MTVTAQSLDPPAPSQAAAGNGVRGSHLYSPAPGKWDEMIAADGSVRPHWQPFVDLIEGATPAQWDARGAAIARLLADHGVTYNIHSDTDGGSRPWVLDSVPFILAEAEWLTVAAGLRQRARLLNA